MSTLTSSVSPAASPRPSGYNQYRPPNRVPKSPRPTSSQPLQSTNSVTNSGTAPPQNLQPSDNSAHQYVDVGTQYSPEGFPPTANNNKFRAGSTRAKRKQESEEEAIADSTSPMAMSEPPSAPQQQSSSHEGSLNTDAAPVQSPTHDDKEADVPAQAASATDFLKRPRTDSRGLKIMPRQYETCDPMDLGVLIADMLMELIRLNDKIPLRDGKLTRFHSRAPPGISCHDYLRRLIQHATLSPPILLSMVFYIDKLCNMYPAFTIGSLTVHRFLITAATVASKGLSDSFWTNPTYARIGGISTSELATLELDFLERVDFKIVPKPETLVDYYNSLVQRSQDYRLEDGSPDASQNGSPDPDDMQAEPT